VPRQCLFCDNAANTLEHVWPLWILQSLNAIQPIRHTIGKNPPFYVNNPAIKVRAVCGTCNERWMSDLETSNRPIIGALMHDISTPIDTSQQADFAAWMMKTAMVIDFMNRQRPQFYTSTERAALRADLLFLVARRFGSAGIRVTIRFMRGAQTFGSIRAKSPKSPTVT
jgi:hypothetical protein